jgi:hypothetical protein
MRCFAALQDQTGLSSAKIASAEPAVPIMLLWHHDRMVTLLADSLSLKPRPAVNR